MSPEEIEALEIRLVRAGPSNQAHRFTKLSLGDRSFRRGAD